MDSLEAVAREWHGKYAPLCVPGHAEKIIRRLERDAFPWLGARPVSEITAPEILSVLRRIEARYCAPNAPKPGAALPLRDRDRAGGTQPGDRHPRGTTTRQTRSPTQRSQTPRPSVPSCARSTATKARSTQCALRLAPLTFVRPGEMRTAEWSEIDLDAAEWRWLVASRPTVCSAPASRLPQTCPPTSPSSNARRLHPTTCVPWRKSRIDSSSFDNTTSASPLHSSENLRVTTSWQRCESSTSNPLHFGPAAHANTLPNL